MGLCSVKVSLSRRYPFENNGRILRIERLERLGQGRIHTTGATFLSTTSLVVGSYMRYWEVESEVGLPLY